MISYWWIHRQWHEFIWIHVNSCKFRHDFTIFFMIMIHEFIYEFVLWIHDPEGPWRPARSQEPWEGEIGLTKDAAHNLTVLLQKSLVHIPLRYLRREQIGMCIKIYATPLEGGCGLPTGCRRGRDSWTSIKLTFKLIITIYVILQVTGQWLGASRCQRWTQAQTCWGPARSVLNRQSSESAILASSLAQLLWRGTGALATANAAPDSRSPSQFQSNVMWLSAGGWAWNRLCACKTPQWPPRIVQAEIAARRAECSLDRWLIPPPPPPF